ncbi:MAG: acyl--CoA ligase [Christensenellaceae bacterium]|jgi:long-chain acyl-CoA synthetase|nr:acyl--CoA ligase [Christensenellaceae bacterium]
MKNIDLRTLSLYEVFSLNAKKRGDSTCFIFEKKSYSYAYVLNQIEKVAYLLVKHGVKFGDIITLVLPNIPQTEYLIYGANKIGAIVHLIHPQSTKERLEGIIMKTGSKFVFSLETVLQEFLLVTKSPKAKLLTLSLESKQSGFDLNKISNKKRLDSIIDFENDLNITDNFKITKYIPRDTRITSYMFNGSGTNGISNIIEMSDYAINAAAPNIYQTFEVKDKTLNVSAYLPLFHILGFAICMHQANCTGISHTLCARFRLDEILEYIENGQMNVFIGAPVIFTSLLNHPKFEGKLVQNLKYAFVGADLVPHKLIDDFDEHMKKNNSSARLFEGYGLSETTATSCVNTLKWYKRYTCGKPLPAAKYRIYDEESNSLKESGTGELYIGGDCLCNGYFKADAENAACFYYSDDGERYLKTGDIMKIDNEGYVSFLARKKRLIKVSGYSVFPSEIEQIAMSVDGIIKACAIGVPDGMTGHRIVLYYEAVRNIVEFRINLHEKCRTYLMPKAVPSEYICLDRIPITPFLKTDANALRNRFGPIEYNQ